MKSRFKRTINWNKYQWKVFDTKAVFRLSDWFEFLRSQQTLCVIIWGWCGQNRQHKIFSVNGTNKKLQHHDSWTEFFLLVNKSDIRTYENIAKVATAQGNNYTAGFFLGFFAWLSKPQRKLRTDCNRSKQTISTRFWSWSWSGNLERPENTTIFFIIEEVKEIILDFPKWTMKVLQMCCMNFNWY